MTKRQLGKPWQKKVAASQEAAGPVCRSDAGEQALKLLSSRLRTVYFLVITKTIITVLRPSHRNLQTVVLSVNLTYNVIEHPLKQHFAGQMREHAAALVDKHKVHTVLIQASSSSSSSSKKSSRKQGKDVSSSEADGGQ